MTIDEIKVRQLTNQHLAMPADMMTVIHDLCGVQAQFMSNALHSLKIRCTDFNEDIAKKRLVKTWTLRGTLHVFAEDDLPLFLHCERKHFLRPCDMMSGDDCITVERKHMFADLIMKKIEEGVDAREDLKAECVAAGMTLSEAGSVFDSWGGTIRALCGQGLICYKVQEKKAFQLCPKFEPMEKKNAELELASRYFTHFAPATVADAAYFFGITQKQVKQQLSQLPVLSTECEGKTYYYIDTSNDYNNISDCIFLAGFDQLMLGYQKTESLYLPQKYLRNIFTLAGIVMPSVLLYGKVVGRWKRAGKKLSVVQFEVIGKKAHQCIEKTARCLWNDITDIEFISL